MFRRLILLALPAACLTAAPAPDAQAGAQLRAAYPEGPLVAGETVLFAEMHKDRIVAWTGMEAEVLYAVAGCGPTAIAPYGNGYAVLCHRADEIHLISKTGKRNARISGDAQGRRFVNPNDASADGRGGVWFSASGVFSRASQPRGALLYLDAEGEIRRLADKLDYANGVHFDRRTRRLFVSEHLSGRILVYPELAPGRPGRPRVFKRFARQRMAGGGTKLMGPDGLETDTHGNLYAAYYGAGLLFILSPEGRTLRRLPGHEPLLTNVALAGNDCTLILTGARRTARPPYPGTVRQVANPLCAGE